MGDSSMGTADEAATAVAIGSLSTSEQMMSKLSWLKVKRSPVERSVALMWIRGPFARPRSAKVAPSKTFSS